MARGDFKRYLETTPSPSSLEILKLGEGMGMHNSSDCIRLKRDLVQEVVKATVAGGAQSATLYETAEGWTDGARLQAARVSLRTVVEQEGFQPIDASARLDRDKIIIGFRLLWGTDPLETYAAAYNHAPTDFDFRNQSGLAARFQYF